MTPGKGAPSAPPRTPFLSPNPPMRSGLGVLETSRGEPYAVGRDGPRSIPINGAGGGLWLSLGAPMAVLGSRAGALGGTAGEDNRGPGRCDSVGRLGSLVEACQAPSVPSGRQWQGSQSSQRASELGFPRPALWQMREAAGRAGEPSGQGEEAPPEGTWWSPPPRPDRCARSSGPGYGPAPGQPCAVGGEAARGEMVEAVAVLGSRIAFSLGVADGRPPVPGFPRPGR